MDLTSLWADVRYVLRQFRKSPAFALSVIVTLTLATSANTSIFSVVHAVLMQPLPYPESERLICVWHADGQSSPWYSFSHPGFEFFREHMRDVADLAAYDDETITVSGLGEPLRIEGGRVSSNFFSALGVRPQLGRDFLEEEDRHRANPVALLSDRFWREHYQADRNVLGRSITVDAEDFTIVGVMPPGFRFQTTEVDVWRSRIVDTRTFAPGSVRVGARYLTIAGRMRPGVTLAQVRTKLRVVEAAYSIEKQQKPDVTAAILQLKLFEGFRNTILLLWGTVVCLLVIACANVASLLLARATSRFQDLSVRLALGASRGRIAQQLLVESMLLSACSVVLALPLSLAGMHWLTAAFQRASSIVPDARLDGAVLIVTIGMAAAIGAVFGLAPMLMLRDGGVQSGLHSGSRAFSASKWSGQMRGAIVAAQLALCLVLLTSAGLLAQSFVRMNTMRSGVHTDHIAIFPLDLMPDRYESPIRRAVFYDDVIKRVGAIGGVKGASIATRIDFFNYGLGYVIQVEGNAETTRQNTSSHGRSVSGDYFRVLGIPLLRGRVFDERDTTQSARVAIVNEAFVKKFLPGIDPIGKHVTYSTDRATCEIVGIVADVRAGPQDTGVEDGFYLPLSQRPLLVARLLVRTEHPEGIGRDIREAVRSVDPRQAMAEARPLDQAIVERLDRPRTTMLVVGVFASFAVFLSAVGIYGVISYSVAQRRKEIGIRMALGADGRRVRSLLFAQTLRMFAIGLIAGVPIAAGLSRLYSSLLFAVNPGDPATFAGAALLLIGVAFAATYVPAIRASRADPLSALRAD